MREFLWSIVKALAWLAGAVLWVLAVTAGLILLLQGVQAGALLPAALGGMLMIGAVAFALVLNDRAKARVAAQRAEAVRRVDQRIVGAAVGGFPADGVLFRVGSRAISWLPAMALLAAIPLVGGHITESAIALVGVALFGLILAPLFTLLIPRLIPGFPAVVVGPEGIDDVLGAGLIEWRDVTGADLRFRETARAGSLMLPVLELRLRDARRYHGRVWPVGRWTSRLTTPDGFGVPLWVGTERAAEAFAAVQYFHERWAPPNQLIGYGSGYMIDPVLGRAKAELGHAQQLLDATVAEMKALESRGITDENSPEFRAWIARSEARLAEVERGELSPVLPYRPAVAQLRVSSAWRTTARALALFMLIAYLSAVFVAVASSYERMFGADARPAARR